MKRLLFCVVIILALIGLAGLHVSHLQKFTDGLIEDLNIVQACLNQSDWHGADKAAKLVNDHWEEEGFYLHTMLRHTDIDNIRTSLKEMRAYLRTREDRAECQAVTAKLINQLELLLEAEQLTLKNLL